MVLLVPGFLYILVNRMGASNEYVKLPIYGEKQLAGTVSVIPVHRYGWSRSVFIDNDTTVSVVPLFYTKDKSFSRTMINRLNKVATNLKRNHKVRFYSISADPASDTPEVLQAYTKGYRPDEKRWFFLTNPSVDILQFAREQLLLDAMKDPQDSSKIIYRLSMTESDTELERLEEMKCKLQLSRGIRRQYTDEGSKRKIIWDRKTLEEKEI
ncbi:hypothetical protein FQR65_LT19426 [Abscondita terminalis]|nr:hypothetical protein FQR65_LT19426 [Abscondita terminalis]